MLVATDQELTHNATDASFGTNVELIIQPDLHGLTIELPNGHIITMDMSKGDLDIYHNEPGEDTDSHNLLRSVPTS